MNKSLVLIYGKMNKGSIQQTGKFQISIKSKSSKFRNNERKNADAKRSFKHEVLKVNGALAIS
ncbi:hypothetical protein [Hanstruepera flava]|uniref:hypothetical protein n=1 Tax=Hanstruepera flava TaxID=2930218 RepID=UPI0020290A3D|nr:hypothetical protein [Hanstruepera flava]